VLLNLTCEPPVYRLRAGVGVDSYGDPVESWDAPDRLILRGATVQDLSTVEDEGPAKRVIRGEKVLFAPGLADVRAEDRIEHRGEVWKVNGDPIVKRGLASAPFTFAALDRVTTS
jgi:hypothetical protein